MTLSMHNGILAVDIYNKYIPIQSINSQDIFDALIAYDIPENVASAVARKLITITLVINTEGE